jgi:hypothetical protein
MKQEYRIHEIESELEQFGQEAQNALVNMKQLDLRGYSPDRIHQWKEDFQEGLDRIRDYSDEYAQLANDVSILGIAARRAVLSCIDCLTRELISRIKVKGER